MSRCARALKPASSSVSAPMTATSQLHGRRQREQHVRARDQVHAGRDHGGRVDQGADRRGAGHGVGQPGLQRQLGRLADGAAQQQRPPRPRPAASPTAHWPAARCISVLDLQRAQVGEQQEQADRHGGVADARDDERLARGVAVGGILVPEADQQVAAQAHALPAQVQQQQVVGQHQDQHRARRTGSCSEEPRCSPRRPP